MGTVSLLLALLVSLPALSLGDPLYILTAPNVLRIESEETVFVEAHNVNDNIDVELRLLLFPEGQTLLSHTSVTLTPENKYMASATVKIPIDEVPKDTRGDQFVTLQAISPVFSLQSIILISHQTGHIFIQTDKAIYTPDQSVLYRLLTVDNELKPSQKPTIVDFVNPQDIIVERNEVYIRDSTGITGRRFNIPEIVNIGQWKIVASYKDAPEENFTTQFDVKEYVLPSFEVTLNSEQNFFYIDDRELHVTISARFTYGKPVEGRAFILFGIMKDGEKLGIPASLQTVPIINGHGEAILTKDHLTASFNDINSLVGSSIYVTASVITHTGSDLVEAEKTGIKIVISPYTISFTKTFKYFKPGMPFEMMVLVTNPDGSPANAVPVKVADADVKSKTHADGIVKLIINTPGDSQNLHVSVITDIPDVPNQRQAHASMQAEPYLTQSGSNNYLHISIQQTNLSPGEDLLVHLGLRNDNRQVQEQIRYFTYMLINKGKIVDFGRQIRGSDQVIVTMYIPITTNLIPSFRLLVYYHVVKQSQVELVADSVWIDVKDTCMGTLKVSPANPIDDKKLYRFGEKFKMKLTGDPGAKVGLVAVDKAVFSLSRKNMITQSKIWSVVEKNDIGCTPGSGRNVFGVFSDAGLAFVTNTDMKTETRTELKCKQPRQRKRRSTQSMEAKAAKSADDDSYTPSEDIITRSNFPESWLWQMFTLPTDHDSKGHANMEVTLYLKDSITTWEIQAVSVSAGKGVCIAQPYEVIVMKDFFIDLQLPYSAVHNEQVEIRAILYNYHDDEIQVRVEFPYNENLCSNAKSMEGFIVTTRILGKSSTVVPFVIVPLTTGEIIIKVKASVMNGFVNDGVEKSLQVVPEGLKIELPVDTYTLDPKGKEHTFNVDIRTPEDIVPNTYPLTLISAQGDILTQTIENIIDGLKLKHLIRVPTGSGEQNMASMTQVVIAVAYLDKTNQWSKVGVDHRESAMKNIQRGYTQELNYRKEDGSYAVFLNRPSSTWLTAYVAKVFAMAHSMIPVEPNLLCGAVNWLINKQKPDGHFQEDAPVIHGEIIGGLRNSEDNAPLTAFVLIAMIEARVVCLDYIASYNNSVKKASGYLENHIGGLKGTYGAVLTAYALSLLGINKEEVVMKFASPDKSYWPVAGSAGSLYTIEATGYALLFFLQQNEFDQAGKIVRWLSKRSEYGGGYQSTQATIVALQAMAEYKIKVPDFKEVDLNVILRIHNRRRYISWRFDAENIFVSRSLKLTSFEKFSVTTSGKGQAELKVLTTYYALLPKERRKCKNFNFEVTVEDVHNANAPDGSLNTLLIKICARYLGATSSSMVILDISMLTGFSPDTNDLGQLKNGPKDYIARFELDKALSTRGSLIIYLDSVSNAEDTCIGFKVHQFFKVGLIQPASVKIYEYYDTKKSCTQFYNVPGNSGMPTKICQGEVCKCAEGSCVSVKTGQQDPQKRHDVACAPGTDYVYKVTFLKKEQRDNYMNFTIKILILAQGSEPVVEGDRRTLIIHASCDETFNVELNKDYLIIGQISDLWHNKEGLRYLIGEETWMERWPSETECQQQMYHRLCQDLTEFSESLQLYGCSS